MLMFPHLLQGAGLLLQPRGLLLQHRGLLLLLLQGHLEAVRALAQREVQPLALRQGRPR